MILAYNTMIVQEKNLTGNKVITIRKQDQINNKIQIDHLQSIILIILINKT